MYLTQSATKSENWSVALHQWPDLIFVGSSGGSDYTVLVTEYPLGVVFL